MIGKMKENTLIKVIIPVHIFNDEVKKLIVNAVNSVPEDISVNVSCKYGLSNELNEALNTFKNVSIVEAEENSPSDFATLVNSAVGGTKWFSVLEFDDVYTPIWFENFKTYSETMPEVSVFLPFQDIVDYKTNDFMRFGNEAPWASSFSNEIGYIDNECLQNYSDFYLTGGIINTERYVSAGKLKTNIKVFFWYEFLLRITNKNDKVFVIPKIGYTHHIGRDGSMVEDYSKTLTDKEIEYWFNTAKKEYFFKNEREIKPFSDKE